MDKRDIIGRLAPSPSGRLHLGNIMSSLLACLDVKSRGGTLLFRLEDLDPDRSYNDYARLTAEDLNWLGIDWDAGWRPDTGSEYMQSERTALYEDAFERLNSRGLVYPCYCSRAQRLAAAAPHPGDEKDGACACRGMTAAERRETEKTGRRPAYRVHVPDKTVSFIDGHYGKYSENLINSGDFIIRRSDGVYAYQLAVSVDDALMGVTRVVRARDLISSAARQIWLIEELFGKAPDYCHAPLLVSPAGRKLSKREGDLNMETLREKYTPEELLGILAEMAGQRETSAPVSMAELIENFDWDKVPRDDIHIEI